MCMLQVIFARGAGEFCSNDQTPASNNSYLIDVTPGANHSIVTENLAFPRVVRNTVTSLYNDCICFHENCPYTELSLLRRTVAVRM